MTLTPWNLDWFLKSVYILFYQRILAHSAISVQILFILIWRSRKNIYQIQSSTGCQGQITWRRPPFKCQLLWIWDVPFLPCSVKDGAKEKTGTHIFVVREKLRICTSYGKSFNKYYYIPNSVYLKRELHSCLSYLHANGLRYFQTLCSIVLNLFYLWLKVVSKVTNTVSIFAFKKIMTFHIETKERQRI